MDDISLKQFTSMNDASDATPYVKALEAFDGIEPLQELKAIGHRRTGIAPGRSVLDVGCGFALETLRLAPMVAPSGTVAGIDKSDDFITAARSRAAKESLQIDFRVGEAIS